MTKKLVHYAKMGNNVADMDSLDERLIAALRRDGRASISQLAAMANISRATVRARLARLEASGEIQGYSVILPGDAAVMPVRGVMMIEIEGKNTNAVVARLAGMTEIEAIHSTNGRWDIVLELGAQTLEAFDAVLYRIRAIDGIAASETNLLLTTLPKGKTRFG